MAGTAVVIGAAFGSAGGGATGVGVAAVAVAGMAGGTGGLASAAASSTASFGSSAPAGELFLATGGIFFAAATDGAITGAAIGRSVEITRMVRPSGLPEAAQSAETCGQTSWAHFAFCEGAGVAGGAMAISAGFTGSSDGNGSFIAGCATAIGSTTRAIGIGVETSLVGIGAFAGEASLSVIRLMQTIPAANDAKTLGQTDPSAMTMSLSTG